VLRNLAQQMLNRLGYGVENVRDGVEAIQIYKRRLDSKDPFEVAILDLTVKGGIGEYPQEAAQDQSGDQGHCVQRLF